MFAFFHRPGYVWAFASNPLHVICKYKRLPIQVQESVLEGDCDVDAGTGEGGRVQIWVKGAVESISSPGQGRARATWQQDRAERQDRWHGTFGAEHVISRVLTV